MFRKTKFRRNSLSAVIVAVLYAVLSMVFVGCSLEGSIESLRQKATDSCSHVWGAFTQTIKPTCTAEGEETRYCTLNSAHTNKRSVTALGHNWGSWKDSTATCTESGYEKRYCIRDSSHTETRSAKPLGHRFEVVYTTATCTSGGYETYKCVRCSKTETDYVDALGHEWSQWSVTVQATETSAGMERRTCYRCGYSESRTIPRISP